MNQLLEKQRIMKIWIEKGALDSKPIPQDASGT